MKKMKSIRYGNVLVCSCLAILLLFSVAQAADVTNSIHVSSSRSFYNSRTGDFSFDAKLENISSDNFSAPIIAVISNLSSDQVTVSNPDGTDISGNPYFDYSGLLSDDNTLSAGEMSGAKKWIFHNPRNVRFTYDVQIISGEATTDDVLPSISITNPVNNFVTTTSTPYITIEFSDDDSGINVGSLAIQINGTDSTSLFGVTNTRATYQATSPLPSGSNVISASISDNGGNTSTVVSDFTIGSSTEPIRYIFSVANNDWIFASPGDETCTQYLSREDLGVLNFSDVVALSKVTPDGNLFFTLSGQGGILQSPADGTNSVLYSNTQLGLGSGDQVVSGHIGLSGTGYISIEGQPNILQSSGNNTNSSFMENYLLGLENTDLINCLHIGYDNTIYFCGPDGQIVSQSTGGSTNTQFLTATELGVPGSTIDGFAILPETIPPTISITNPMDGAFLNTTTPNIQITFQDSDSGIDRATFYAEINGADMTSAFSVSDTGATYQVPDSSPLPVGGNTLLARIGDRVGNEAGATSNFTLGILRAIPGATPTSGPAPLTVYFTTDGEDPSGTIEVFRWDFDGNGTWDNYNTVARDYNHTYNTPGTYNATLYVKSSTGESTTASITITVENNPPVATADVVPSNGEVPLTAQLMGSGTDSDGSIVFYEWDFEGDGIYDWSSSSMGNTTYTYNTVGTYQAVFRVTDDNGLTDTATAATTVVRTGPPGSPTATASASPTSGNAPLTVNFNGTATDPDNDIVKYEWDFDGDGTYDWSSATTGSTSHTYNTAGTHVASLRVTDGTGLTGIDQILITVNIQTSLSIANDTVGFPDNSSATLRPSGASAYSQHSSYYSASRAIDGNTGTYWHSRYGATAGSWFEVTFDTPQTISKIMVNWYSSSYQMNRGRIDVYDSTGSIVYSEETDFVGVPSLVSLPNVENASKVRLEAITTASSYLVIREFTYGIYTGQEPEPTGTNINTSISAGTPVSILIKDSVGNTVRTLVNNQYRDMGSYSDYWDCKDGNGIVVNDGVHYAILQYIVDGQVKTYDLTHSTGGTRYSFPIGSGCNTRADWTSNFSPFEDQQLALKFTICSAQEVTAFIGPLWSGADATRIATIVNRQAFPAGTHTIYWDGMDDNGNIAQNPPGDTLITGFWRYDLPDNVIYMTGGNPTISDISADPNYFSPFSEKCDENGNGEGVTIDYTVSENVASVELRVYSIETGSLLRTLVVSNVPAGDNVIFWDGKNNNGEYVDIGDYRVGLIATDGEGNESMFSYCLVRIDY